MSVVPISKNRTKRFGSNRTQQVWDKTKGKCWYCGIDLLPPTSDESAPLEYVDQVFTMDHLTPLSKGGKKNDLGNLVPCCRRDNNLKANYDIEYLRMRLLFIQEDWPKFNPAQFDFLASRGIILSRIHPFQFYFEREKLK